MSCPSSQNHYFWWLWSGCSPLPIPNREVKPRIADDTALVCGKVGRRQSFIRSSFGGLLFFVSSGLDLCNRYVGMTLIENKSVDIMAEGLGRTVLRFLLWCLFYCVVAVVGNLVGSITGSDEAMSWTMLSGFVLMTVVYLGKHYVELSFGRIERGAASVGMAVLVASAYVSRWVTESKSQRVERSKRGRVVFFKSFKIWLRFRRGLGQGKRKWRRTFVCRHSVSVIVRGYAESMSSTSSRCS